MHNFLSWFFPFTIDNIVYTKDKKNYIKFTSLELADTDPQHEQFQPNNVW